MAGTNGKTYSIACAIRGPITLITVGVLFALQNFTNYGFDRTWPVLLIVFGLLSLLRRGVQPVPAGAQPFGYQAPGTYPPPSYPPPPYAPPPAAPVKGGFGTSAPSRAADSSQTPPESGGSL